MPQSALSNDITSDRIELSEYTGNVTQCRVFFLDQTPVHTACNSNFQMLFSREVRGDESFFNLGTRVSDLMAFIGVEGQLGYSPVDENLTKVISKLSECPAEPCFWLNNVLSEFNLSPSDAPLALSMTQLRPMNRVEKERSVWIFCGRNRTIFLWSEDSQFSFGTHDVAVSIIPDNLCELGI